MQSCEKIIHTKWESRLEDLKVIMDENDQIKAMKYPLSFDKVDKGTFEDQTHAYWRYQMSWGGGSDEIRYFLNDKNEIFKIEYWYLDWLDGASIELLNEEKKLAEWLYQACVEE